MEDNAESDSVCSRNRPKRQASQKKQPVIFMTLALFVQLILLERF